MRHSKFRKRPPGYVQAARRAALLTGNLPAPLTLDLAWVREPLHHHPYFKSLRRAEQKRLRAKWRSRGITSFQLAVYQLPDGTRWAACDNCAE